MYRKALVPLDGSELAECALHEALKLARGGFVEEVVILSVVDVPSVLFAGMESFAVVDMKNGMCERTREYLARIASDLAASGITVKTALGEGEAARTIIDYATENVVDLIVIATHGYTGFKQWLLGSIARKVLERSPAPVLLIRPHARKASD
jgi:nucleotide-binding universal stress UspA family protein